VNSNPDNPVIGKLERSFSADPEVVARHALVWVDAHRRFGILCALKHFPGHGSSRADSHLGFVDVSDTWTEIELKPYRRVIEAGKADLIMTAHIFNRHLDPQLPGTLSAAVINGLLRERLDFGGVVVSDDLQMKAISDHYGLETAVEKAVNAGVDLLVFGNNSVYDPDIAERSIAVIKRLISNGKISPKRIQQSYERIIRLKGSIDPER
jgi:beta-N-acetylhexosaminidase